MTASVFLVKKKRLGPANDAAYSFLNSIESTWNGHQKFVCWLVKIVKPKTVVDLGFDRGLSTISFAYKNKGHVYGIDWFDNRNYATKCFALDTAFRNISNAIRFQYAKNIHLIVGPYQDISKKWVRKINILHIDWAHSYGQASAHYENWKKFMSPDGVVLVHDVVAFPTETGRFFNELPMHRFIFPHAQGLGVASTNEVLIQQIKKTFCAVS